MNLIWIAPLGAFMNWFVRGGGIESALLNYRNLPGTRYLNAAVYGMTFGLLAQGWLVGGLAALAMVVGQAPGWGEYIMEMHIGKPWRGVWKMSLRGAFWTFCLSVPLTINSTQLAAVCAALSGLIMGPVYYGCIRAFKGRGNRWLNEWTVAEMFFGALLWSPLTLL
jgi:hypothetical protein